MIEVALAVLAGVGVALIVSVWLWPNTPSDTPNRPSRIRDLLHRADMSQTTPGVFITVSVLTGCACGIVAVALGGIPVLGLLAGIMGGGLPTLAVRQRAIKRAHTLRTLWPDIIDHLIASVRSGMGLADAIATLARTGPKAVRPGFQALTNTYRATGSFQTAARNAKDLLADPIADRLLVTLEMANQVGGTQLIPILRSLGTHLREAQSARHEVEARQSWVINAARLGVTAPWVVLTLLLTRPEAALAYNSPLGAVIIIVGAVITVMAYRLMIYLGRLPEEQRWFA